MSNKHAMAGLVVMDRKRLIDSFLDALAIIGLAAMLLLGGIFLLVEDTDGTGSKTTPRPNGGDVPSSKPIQASQYVVGFPR